MTQLKHLLLLCTAFLLLATSCGKDEKPDPPDDPAQGRFLDDWTYDVFLTSSSSKNTYKLWIPEGAVPRGILVLTPGGLANGINMVKDQKWQEYAKKENLALLGAYVNGDYSTSASNLRLAIREIAKARELDYLNDLPFLLRGHSSGGGFSYAFAQAYKRSTIAWSNIKGRMRTHDVALPPGLYIVGEKDLEDRNSSILAAFRHQRQLEAVACYAQEPEVGHSEGNSDVLIKAFFSAVLSKSLSTDGTIETLLQEDLLLADNDSLQVYPYLDYPGDKSLASCIVDDSFARDWTDFVSK